MLKPWMQRLVVTSCVAIALGVASGPWVEAHSSHDLDQDDHQRERTLYIWAGDQERKRPDFLAVIDFDERSPFYGRVLRTVPLPPPGAAGNEPHHCHLSADKNILACGGLLSVLKGQPGIFFFDVSHARHPVFLFATSAPNSSITDDFLPLPGGGFLVTQMGSATGGTPGRLAEFDHTLTLIAEYPAQPPDDGFNPHGISAAFRRNLLVTSDFINPVTTLNGVNGDDVELRGSLRFWNLANREITQTVRLPEALGTMDVKLIPRDPNGRAVTVNMFSGLVYTVDPTDSSVVKSFDCENIVPHIEVPVRGGMVQLLAMPKSGDRLIFASFQAGQIGMLDISDRTTEDGFVQKAIVNLGEGAGPHDIVLTKDDSRLVVTDYFLNQDDFGKIHFEGDHKVHVIKVTPETLKLDRRFKLDFDKEFKHKYPLGARPHGIAMK
jgi:hypothetical protein